MRTWLGCGRALDKWGVSHLKGQNRLLRMLCKINNKGWCGILIVELQPGSFLWILKWAGCFSKYISHLLYSKISEKIVLKKVKPMLSSSMMPKWIIKKTVKTVIEDVWDARHCTEPSTCMTSFNFPKEPLILSLLYRYYQCSGMLSNSTKISNFISGKIRLLIYSVAL